MSENLARSKLAYISSISSYKWPHLAVDTTIDINQCSLTAQANSHNSWYIVDIEKIYKINKVCLLNSNTGIFTYKNQLLFFSNILILL